MHAEGGNAYPMDNPQRDYERGIGLERVYCQSFGNGRAARDWRNRTRVLGRGIFTGRDRFSTSLPTLTASLVWGGGRHDRPSIPS
jgi:hypothetical protein